MCSSIDVPHKLIYPIPGSTRVEGVLEAAKANEVRLSVAEVADIRQLVEEAGQRHRSVAGVARADIALPHTQIQLVNGTLHRMALA